jgi:hypothetical protein
MILLMQGQIRPNPTTPTLLGTPSSGPDVNPPSSDLGLQSRSPVAIASAAPRRRHGPTYVAASALPARNSNLTG